MLLVDTLFAKSAHILCSFYSPLVYQVVAGLNYKLTISIHNKSNNKCLGGIKDITVYKALPYMNQPLKIISFGTILDCTDEWLVSLIDSVKAKEEENNALLVEQKIEKEVETVEPDA